MTLLRHAVGPSHLPWVVRGDYRPTCDQRTLSTHATDPLEIEADTGPAEERLNACQRDDHYLAVLRATLAPRRSCAPHLRTRLVNRIDTQEGQACASLR